MSPEHRRFLIVDQGVGGSVVNFLLNAGIAWALFHSVAEVPLWGESSIAGDTVITAFLLPLLTCLIVSRTVRHQVTQGRVAPLTPPASGVLRSLATLSVPRRGVVLGLAGVALAALPTLLALGWSGLSALPRDSFLWFKAGFAALLAAGVTPLVGWLALAAPEAEAVRTGSR